MTDGRELPGAKLKITDASGNTIAEWETNGQPHRIERLKPSDYTLTETAAPAGYLLSEEVHFTVQETGKIQKVTMHDAPAHSLILTKRDIATNAKLADARLTIRDAYGTTIDRWTTTDGDHAIRVLPERSAAKDPHKNLLLLSDDTSKHVYTMVEELAPDGYLVAESITFKVMQMNDNLVVFIWQDGGWQKSSEGYLAMYDERTDTPVPLMKFSRRPAAFHKNCAELLRCAQFEIGVIFCLFPVLLPPIRISASSCAPQAATGATPSTSSAVTASAP